jgi:hypothetical protein
MRNSFFSQLAAGQLLARFSDTILGLRLFLICHTVFWTSQVTSCAGAAIPKTLNHWVNIKVSQTCWPFQRVAIPERNNHLWIYKPEHQLCTARNIHC